MSEFWPQFWSATFENWQSEWLQLFVQAVILLGMKHVLFKADAEDMEQVQMDLAEIKEHLASRLAMTSHVRSWWTPRLFAPPQGADMSLAEG